MNHNLLEVKNLSVQYEAQPNPVKAVNGVAFSIRDKEIFGICGESGCGKTTLMKAIIGLLKPPGYIVGGKILYKGTDLTSLNEREFRRIRWKEISYIPQASMSSLNPVLTVLSQMIDTIDAHERRVPKTEMIKSVSESLNMVLLSPEVLHTYPHELSGGMKQRVLVALAIGLSLLQPKLIIADEPTSNLDVTTERYILKALTDLKQKFDVSMIFVTHNMAAQAQIADRLAIMYAGEMAEIGDVDVMFKEPLHPYTKALISATPSISEVKKLSSLPGIPPDLRDPPKGCNFHPRCPSMILGKCDAEDPKLIEAMPNRFVKCHLVSEQIK